MRTIIVLIGIIILIVNISASAKIINYYGIKLGVTKASQNWNYPNLDIKRDGAIWGITAGAFSEFLNFHYFTFVSEMYYVPKGMSEKYEKTTVENPAGTGEIFELTNKLDYLSFSFLAKIKTKYNNLIPFISIGPRLDIQLKNHIEKGYEIIYNNFKKTIYGLSVALGSEIKLPVNFKILIEFQYNSDLSFPYKTDELRIKNNSFDFRTGVMF